MQINNCYNQAQVRKKEPYFKATIYYVDGATFEEKQKLLVDCYEVGNPIRSDFTIEEAAVNKSSAYTLSARDCVVSSIFNPETKKVNQNHLAPYQKTILSIDEVAETMFAHTQQLLGNSKIRLEGFLTAGEGYMRTDEDLKLFQMFENNFKKVSNILGMDYSVIAQRRDGQTQVDLIDCYEVGNPIRSDFTIEEAAVNKSSAYTLSARDCVVSSIFNPETKKVNQNHLAPYQKTILSIDEVAETMFAHTQQLLGNSKIRLEGFLTAGEGYMRTDEDLKLFQMFENNFKKVSNILGMDYSVIAQRRDGQTQVDLISDAVADAHYVYVKDNEGKNLIENLSDFMDAFVIKILSPKDKLVIMGKDVTEGFRPLGFKSLRV